VLHEIVPYSFTIDVDIGRPNDVNVAAFVHWR